MYMASLRNGSNSFFRQICVAFRSPAPEQVYPPFVQLSACANVAEQGAYRRTIKTSDGKSAIFCHFEQVAHSEAIAVCKERVSRTADKAPPRRIRQAARTCLRCRYTTYGAAVPAENMRACRARQAGCIFTVRRRHTLAPIMHPPLYIKSRIM